VIGANSVVRGEIPDYCIAAGNPAVVVKCLVPEVSESRSALIGADLDSRTPGS
jgi:acetyltransferase-like isoleucine patch superfamily enzyme